MMPGYKKELEPLRDYLVAVLKRHELSDRAFCLKFKIPPQTLSQLKKCEYSPRIDTLQRLASAISQLPGEAIGTEDLVKLMNSDRVSEDLTGVSELNDMCVLYLSGVIEQEFRQRGLDIQNPDHFRQLTSAAPTLWERAEDLILLRQLCDRSLPARFLTKELFASLTLTLRRWTGDTEKYDLERFLQEVLAAPCDSPEGERSPLLN